MEWMAWIEAGEDTYVLPLRQENIVIEPDRVRFRAVLYSADGDRLREIAGGVPGSVAMKEAQSWVARNRKGELDLVYPLAKWRRLPATKEQKDYMKRHHLAFEPSITAGDAAAVIVRHAIRQRGVA